MTDHSQLAFGVVNLGDMNFTGIAVPIAARIERPEAAEPERLAER